ncbi:hypothetical protein GJAV_G00158140 [Gymnothorax javanicus]|nr:hypothetical protein GJAV_G00158140 [Gymnothorax javanicus]
MLLQFYTPDPVYSVRRRADEPLEHGAGVRLLPDATHHTAVLQGHALQQAVVHVVADADGEDTELLLHRRPGVDEDVGRSELAHRRVAVRQEDDQRHTVVVPVCAEQVQYKLQSGYSPNCWWYSG